MPSPSPAPLPALASPRGAHARPAHSPSKTMSLRKRIAHSPTKKALAPEFTTQWTPTRMSEQLKNATAAARKQRAWDREPRRKATSTARTQKTIYKRFDRDAQSGSVTIRKTASPAGKAVKKLRLDEADGAGRVAAWDSPRRALPHKMPLTVEDADAQLDLGDAETDDQQDISHDQRQEPTDAQSLGDEAATQELTGSVELEMATPLESDSQLTTDGAHEASMGEMQESKEVESASASEEAEQNSLAEMAEVSSAQVCDVEEEKDDSDAELSEGASTAQHLPLPRIYTPHPGTFTVPDFDDSELTEDTFMEDVPARPELEPQHPDLTSEITAAPLDMPSEAIANVALESTDADATVQDATVTEALPSRLFNLPENQVGIVSYSAEAGSVEESLAAQEADAQELAPEEATETDGVGHSDCATENQTNQEDRADEDNDMFNLSERASATTDADMDETPVQETAGEDMFDIDVQSLKAAPIPTAATPSVHSTLAPASTWMIEETTTTVQLNDNDDETVLRDFLTRSNANKAAKIARRSSLSNKRDSDAVRLALASPRKPLEEMDTNSPLMSPRKEQDGAIVTLKDVSSPTRRGAPKDAVLSEDDELARDTTMPPTRRSGRGHSERALRQHVPSTQRTITVRREDHLVIKRSEAQELSVLTRANTRRNKGGSVPASMTLKRLQGLTPEEIKERAVAAAGERAVRWNEDELVSFFVEHVTKDGSTGAAVSASTGEAAQASEQAAAGVPSKPKARRARALGAVNGTPAKKKAATAKSADGEVGEAAADEAGGEPTQSKMRSPRKAASAAGAGPREAEKHNAVVPDVAVIGAAGPTAAQKPVRKSMVPRPRSSARLRRDT